MALLTITINDPGLEKKSSEVAFANHALQMVMKEFGRGNGQLSSGTIVGQSANGATNTALGSWTYLSVATKP
jgi:hypothetical protein